MNLRNISRLLLIPIIISLVGNQFILAADTPVQPPMANPAPQPIPAKPTVAHQLTQNPWIIYGACAVAGWCLGSLSYKWNKQRLNTQKQRKKQTNLPEMPKFVNKTVRPLINIAATTGALMAVLYGTVRTNILSPEMGNRVGYNILFGGLGAALNFLFAQAVEKSEAEPQRSFKSDITFKDLAGSPPADIQKLLLYLKSPRLRFALDKKGIKPATAFLLYGPPGTGKTRMAAAIAGEVDIDFIEIAYNTFMTKWSGEPEQKVKDIFKEARDRAKKQGRGKPKKTILFFDEFDALASKRDKDNNKSDFLITLLNAILRELDGLEKDEHIIAIASTNRIHDIDPAILSRFGKPIYVGEPDQGTIKEFIVTQLTSEKFKDLQLANGETPMAIADQIIKLIQSKNKIPNFRDLESWMNNVAAEPLYMAEMNPENNQQVVLNSEFIMAYLDQLLSERQPRTLQLNNGVVSQRSRTDAGRKDDAASMALTGA